MSENSSQVLGIVRDHVTQDNFPWVFLSMVEFAVIVALLWFLWKSMSRIEVEIEKHRQDDAGLHTNMLQTLIDVMKSRG